VSGVVRQREAVVEREEEEEEETIAFIVRTAWHNLSRRRAQRDVRCWFLL
jgi:hypothetical protein